MVKSKTCALLSLHPLVHYRIYDRCLSRGAGYTPILPAAAPLAEREGDVAGYGAVTGIDEGGSTGDLARLIMLLAEGVYNPWRCLGCLWTSCCMAFSLMS